MSTWNAERMEPINARLRETPCSVEGCTRMVFGHGGKGWGGMCGVHAMRMKRGINLVKPIVERRSPKDALREAALKYADAEDGDFDSAWKSLTDAAKRYVRSLG